MAKSTIKTLEITITVDHNDADYLTEVSAISESDLEKLMPLIKAIKAFKPYVAGYHHHSNYSTGDSLRDDMGEKSPRELYALDDSIFDLFEEYVPYCEQGFHSVVSIEVCPLVKKTKLL